jgi:hypothetical protein
MKDQFLTGSCGIRDEAQSLGREVRGRPYPAAGLGTTADYSAHGKVCGHISRVVSPLCVLPE